MTKKLPLSPTLLINLLFALLCNHAFAQIDLQCNGRDMHSIYVKDYVYIYRIDSVDTSPTNPILLSPGPTGEYGGGISINNNLDSIAGPETMYFIALSSPYYFWNGTGWTNTFHTSGSLSSGSINIGGTSNYIFNYHDNENEIYRYDGTGTGTLLVSNIVSNGGVVHDVATDSIGNFYLFFTNDQKIRVYNPNGIPIALFTTSGSFPAGINCGFTLLGNRFYAVSCSAPFSLHEGIKSGTNINFTVIKNLPAAYIDIASCPSAAFPLATFKNPELPHFAMYPNPARDAAVIKLHNTATLEVYDYMGILKQTIPVKGLLEYRLDVSHLKAGIYFINAISANETSARSTLVVQH